MSEWTWKRFAGCDDETFRMVSGWPSGGAPAAAETLKQGSVWRVGPVVVKQGHGHRLRRSVRAWQWLKPILSPEPLVLGLNGRQGILGMRNCPGVPLAEAWGDANARAAMADLIAALYGRRIVHGDLTPSNFLWDGRQIWLVDLDGLRNPLHALFWPRHVRMTWAWLYHRLPDRSLVRPAYERCCRALGLPTTDKQWQRIVAEEQKIRAGIR